MTWDTVVIGSGPGGLSAAVALARAGQKVLVLEQHTLPGGWSHSFTLEGHRFSPGVHYLGALHQGGALRRLYEGLGVAGDLEFCEMNPEAFDHFIIEGKRFDQPRGRKRWLDRLSAAFPHEREGLARYFGTLGGVMKELNGVEELLRFPKVLALPFKAPRLMRWGMSTLQALLESRIKDPMLRAILSAQCGNHGLAPSRVSLPLHAAMAAHYDDGAFYPRGGAKRIPAAFIKALRKHGGQIRVGTRVTEIIVESGRAAGVITSEGEVIPARNVVCNADPSTVFGTLLPEKHCRKELKKARRMEYSVSALSLFVAVEMDLRGMGYDSGNYWWYRNTDVDGIYRRAEHTLPESGLEALFLAITSLKDPGHTKPGIHTLELFTFVPWELFSRWSGTSLGERGSDYRLLKQGLADRVLDTAEKIIPNLRSHVRFLEIGTPLTNDYYCETHRGALYGTAKTPWQMGPFSFGQHGPVDGLHFCGASTFSHGVAGAAISGLIAAAPILGHSSFEQCLGPTESPLRIVPADAPELWLQPPLPQVAQSGRSYTRHFL
jgi:phytoene dehydrogenase-like protein